MPKQTQKNNRWSPRQPVYLDAMLHVSGQFPFCGQILNVGLGGLFGSATAMLFSESAGFILQSTGSYWSLFLIAGWAYLLALALMHALTPRMMPVEFARQ